MGRRNYDFWLDSSEKKLAKHKFDLGLERWVGSDYTENREGIPGGKCSPKRVQIQDECVAGIGNELVIQHDKFPYLDHRH